MKPLETRNDPYREWISRASDERHTRVILALDIDGLAPESLLVQGRRLLRGTIENLCALKLGRQTVLSLGTHGTKHLIEIAKGNGIPSIIDDKLNDIGETNKSIARTYFRMGFDGLTANPFAGWRDGLQPVFQMAHDKGMGVILLVFMSHPGAQESYGQRVLTRDGKTNQLQYELFAHKAVRWKADGAVVGATHPRIIVEARSILTDKVPIYSPGVGAQGGLLREALKAGTNYFIIGRGITTSPNPGAAAAKYARLSVARTS